MRIMLFVLATLTLPGFIAAPSQTWAQAKTAKACVAEWRADRADFQAKGITEKVYVEQCRAPTAGTTTRMAAPSSTPPAAIVPSQTAQGTRGGRLKSAKACAAEWRSDKTNFKAKGISERAYVAQRRAATATALPAPSNLSPRSPAPATAPPRPSATTAAPAQTPYGSITRNPSIGRPIAPRQYARETQAKAVCPTDTVVWVNLRSKIYHFSLTHNYGNPKRGAFMCERDAISEGFRPAENERHS